VHDGNFGARCEQCHSTDNWKKISNRSMGASGEPAQPAAAATPARRSAGALFNDLLGWSSHMARRHDIEPAGSRTS
jgi:hypothetical protein